MGSNKQHIFSIIACWGILVACLVVIMGSIRDQQGWGGDYAGYLLETKAIVTGRNLAQSDYIYNVAASEIAPPAYPIGYPLLLTPVYNFFGLDITAFARYMGVFYWFLGIGLFLFLKRYYSIWIALFSTVFFLFNPFAFFGKSSILSDVPFTICVIAGTLLYVTDEKYSRKTAIFIGLIAGYAWLIRAVGFVFPIVIVLHFLLEHFYIQRKNRVLKSKDVWVWSLLVLGTAFLMQVAFHQILFQLPASGSYFDQIDVAKIGEYCKRNLGHYTNVLLSYFQLQEDMSFVYGYKCTDAAVRLGGSLAIALALLGIISTNQKHERYFLLFSLAYLGVILAWPSYQGFRFLLPILPFLLYFILKAIDNQQIATKWGNRLKWWLIPVLLVGEYEKIDSRIYEYSAAEEIGSPGYKNNQEAYQFIKDSIPQGNTFAYHHPLIFALYTERPVTRWGKSSLPQEIQSQFEQLKVTYLLVNDWLLADDQPLKNYLKENSNHLDTIWHNERNVLYKFK